MPWHAHHVRSKRDAAAIFRPALQGESFKPLKMKVVSSHGRVCVLFVFFGCADLFPAEFQI